MDCCLQIISIHYWDAVPFDLVETPCLLLKLPQFLAVEGGGQLTTPSKRKQRSETPLAIEVKVLLWAFNEHITLSHKDALRHVALVSWTVGPQRSIERGKHSSD